MPKLETMWPEKVKVLGGLCDACFSPDRNHLLLQPYQSRGELALVSRGDKNIKRFKLETYSIDASQLGAIAQNIYGLVMLERDGRTVIVAGFDDDWTEGPGIGLFDLDGKALAIEYYLDEPERLHRTTSSTRNRSFGHVNRLVVSPDGEHVATAMFVQTPHPSFIVRWWKSADIVAGKLVGTDHPSRSAGSVAFDARGGLVWPGKHEPTIHRLDLETGVESLVTLEPAVDREHPNDLWSVGDVFVTGDGEIVEESGALREKLPGAVREVVQAGRLLVAVGADRKNDKHWTYAGPLLTNVWFYDLDKRAIVMNFDEPKTGEGLAAIAGEVVVFGVKNNAIIVPPP